MSNSDGVPSVPIPLSDVSDIKLFVSICRFSNNGYASKMRSEKLPATITSSRTKQWAYSTVNCVAKKNIHIYLIYLKQPLFIT